MKACWPRCTSVRARCSPPTPKSTPGSAGCCPNRSRSSELKRLRPAVQKITDDHIDALLAGAKPGDIVSTLSLPVPSLVISELLGVPYEDAEFFQAQAQRGMGRYATEEDTAQGAASLAKYLANLVRTKMQNPSEDLVSDLAERVNAEEISVREAAQLATGVLIAGMRPPRT